MTASVFTIRPFPPSASLRLADGGRSSQKGREPHKTMFGPGDLYWANLSQASLQEADLRDAVLCGADLTETDLRGADLRGANLGLDRLGGSTMLQGALMNEAQLAGASMAGAHYDDSTVFPERFDPVTHGMREVAK